MSDVNALLIAFKKSIKNFGPYEVEHNNDVGPDDDRFWEWWEVAGIKFEKEEQAIAFRNLLSVETYVVEQ